MLLRMYRLNLTHKMNDPKNLILLVSYFIYLLYFYLYFIYLSISGRLPRVEAIISPQIFTFIFCFYCLWIMNRYELKHLTFTKTYLNFQLIKQPPCSKASTHTLKKLTETTTELLLLHLTIKTLNIKK